MSFVLTNGTEGVLTINGHLFVAITVYTIHKKSRGFFMKTVNTVIANIERNIRFSNKKQENMIYQYRKAGRELSRKKSVNKFGSDFIGNVTIGMKKKGIEDKVYTRRGLYTMIQFYEAYSDWDMYGKHLKNIKWSSHILLLDGIEERDRPFWLELCMNKRYSVRKIK